MTILKRILTPFFLLLFLSALFAEKKKNETYYFAIEMNGVLCGYSEMETKVKMKGDKEIIELKQNVFTKVSALGSQFTQNLKLTYFIDPETGNFTYHDSYIKQGQTELSSAIYIESDSARFTSSISEDFITILPKDVILPNTLYHAHLKKDFINNKLEEKKYQIYSVRDAGLQEETYTKIGNEELNFNGKTYQTVIINQLNHANGLKVKLWLDTESGIVLKTLYQTNRLSYLTDVSVKEKVKRVNLDDYLFAKTNKSISDIQGISYMKVKTTIDPTGLWVTPEGLNVPGQKFTGTVEENLIEGTFEIQHKRYDGSDAPQFPSVFCKIDSLQEYLQPEGFIESGDPVLIDKAKEITEGSKDSWEAACRLSKWVAENIGGAVPGGTTARNTYDIRCGECGAHSMLLAAFCRGVGIPARVVWGCMYAPNYGGSFGQHAWNEVFMGAAGWIPVDATIHEHNYVDSGHIRIGTYQSTVISLNPKKMEISDYKLGNSDSKNKVIPIVLKPYIGKYKNPENGNVLKLLLKDRSLTLDIPQKAILPFHEPDDEESWYCKYSKQVYLKFKKNDAGKVEQMKIHEIAYMPKTVDLDSLTDLVPENFKPYLGTYYFQAINKDFEISYIDSCLTLQEPEGNFKLYSADENGRWTDETQKRSLIFEKNEDNSIKGMRITYIATLNKLE